MSFWPDVCCVLDVWRVGEEIVCVSFLDFECCCFIGVLRLTCEISQVKHGGEIIGKITFVLQSRLIHQDKEDVGPRYRWEEWFFFFFADYPLFRWHLMPAAKCAEVKEWWVGFFHSIRAALWLCPRSKGGNEWCDRWWGNNTGGSSRACHNSELMAGCQCVSYF